MKVNTTRFGEINVDEGSIVTMGNGLIGFGGLTRYVIIEHQPGSAFFWLQSLERPDLAFVIVDPFIFERDYEVHLSQELIENLQVKDPADINIYVIVTIPRGRPGEMTANLLGPLVFNTPARLAMQVVLDDRRYSHRHPIAARPQA